MLPAPKLERRGRFLVVRDDLLPGGSKMRAVLPMLVSSVAQEFVYASPAQGYAQLALAHCARLAGRRATIFTAARKAPHALTLAAQAAGARVVFVPHGRLNVVQAHARRYAAHAGAELLPFGLDSPQCIESLAAAARLLGISPSEVWTVAGSGVLTRSLQSAWPGASFHAVLVGRQAADVGRAARWVYGRPFDAPARVVPPFPCSLTYDAKGWELMQQRAPEGALFWNVAG